MLKSGLRYVSLGISVFVLGILFLIFMPDRLAYWQEFRGGSRIISSVESFKKTHHRLPVSLQELNIEEDRVYYCKADADGQFLVWFGTRLGESMTYESSTGKWIDLNRVCGK